MKSPNIEQLSYIRQAQDYYAGLVKGEIESYSSIIFTCLYQTFNIQTIDDVKILQAISFKLFSDYVYLKKDINWLPIDELIKNISNYVISCDKEDVAYEAEEFECINIGAKTAELTPNLISYHNHYKWIQIASEIIRKRSKHLKLKRDSLTLCKHSEWCEKISKEFKKINNYQSIVKFCISYKYYTEKDVVKKHFQILPLQFYYLVIKSILRAEYLYISDYKDILRKIDDKAELGNMDAFTVLPDIVTYGIEPIQEMINKCDRQYRSLLDNNEKIAENIHLEAYVENKFCRPKYKNEQVSIETGQWIPIVDIIKLAYEISFIDIAYVSSTSNIRLLMSLIKGINDLNEYYNNENFDFIGSIDNKLWKRIKSVNQMLRIKAAILLSQIIEQEQPKGDSPMIPKKCYGLSDDTINYALKEVVNITRNIENPFIKYYKKQRKNNVDNIEDLFQQEDIKPLSNLSLLECFKSYNNYAKEGIILYLRHVPIYSKIKKSKTGETSKEDERAFINELKSYIESKDILVYDIPPSLYVETIKYLHALTQKYIDHDIDFATDSLELLDKMNSLLRQATLSYQNGYTIPYRFRPLLEYSFYEYKDGDLLLYKTSELADFIQRKNNDDDDNIFFISSLYPINPINFLYLENFYYYYNRVAHRLHNEKDRQLLNNKEQSIKKLLDDNLDKAKGDVEKEMNQERKKTIQLLGVFGTFIAFVSSVAGMVKAVNCIVDFMLFCMTFVVCLLIFIWCLNALLNTTKEEPKWKIGCVIISLLVILTSTPFCLYYKFSDIKKVENTEINDSNHSIAIKVGTNNTTSNEQAGYTLTQQEVIPSNQDIKQQIEKPKTELIIEKDSINTISRDTIKTKQN